MIPTERERVRRKGCAGVYFVLGVNLENGFASLLNLTEAMRLEDVPFSQIEPFRFEPEPDLPSMI